MGVKMYWIVVAIVIVLGLLMPQNGYRKKFYIILMACLHTFVCGFRYMYLTGDLIKYNTIFQDVHYFGYFSERVLNEGKNTGFMWVMKFISDTTNGNYQFFLFLVALVIETAVAIVIYKYSPKPWLSYLVWNCVGFYIFGFSAVKQSLAMALVLLAVIFIIENKPVQFTIVTLLAGFIHFPAFAFVPAYWISKRRINLNTIIAYVIAAGLIFAFRNQIVAFITGLYYEEDAIELSSNAELGGRFFMITLVLVCGIVLKGFKDRRFEKVFNLIVIAAIFQMFSGFDNVFTRFTDYYFQFTILYIPMLFCNQNRDPNIVSSNVGAILPFNEKSLQIFSFLLVIVLVWYYHYTCLGTTIAYAVDDYLNYRFMWSVVP